MNAKRVRKRDIVYMFPGSENLDVSGGVVKFDYNGQKHYSDIVSVAEVLGIPADPQYVIKARLDLSVPKAGLGDYSIKSEGLAEGVEYLKKAGELKELPVDIALGNEDVYKRLIV